MHPRIWGQHGWKFIHLIAMEYSENPTEEDIRNYRNYFYSLQAVLPCEKCRYNYARHLEKYPLNDEIMSSRTRLLQWTIDLHNIVNYDTNKNMLTYEEALDEINKMIYPTNNNKIYLLILIIIIIIIIAIYFLKIRKNV